MGKKISRLGVIVLVLVLVMLCGCDKKNNNDKDNSDKDKNKSIRIGFSFDSFVIERWRKDSEVFTSKIKDYDGNAEVNVQNANGDKDVQISQINYLIDKKYDVIVIVGIDANGLSDVVKKAKKAGIPVIAYDRLIRKANVDLYISFDNEQVGTLMGEELVESGLPRKKVLKITGPEEDNNVSMVEKGFDKVMKENGIEIIKPVVRVDNWNSTIAEKYIRDEKNREILEGIDGIMCGNDDIATTVIRTLSECHLEGDIKVVGQDADVEACRRIAEGNMLMTVYKPVEKLAEKAAEYAIDFAKKKRVDIKGKISDGENDDIPYVCLPVEKVDKNNLDEKIIESGFHLYDEIYGTKPKETEIVDK